MTAPSWLTAFLDYPADSFDAGVAFWEGVTGYQRSAPRGEREEFATLVPPTGDDFLRVQRVEDGPPRLHLDVHVSSLPEGSDRGFETTASPGGMVFCWVTQPAARRPPPRDWGGYTSLVDQVCLDIAPSAYDEECAFWQHLTGWELRHHDSSRFSMFSSLVRPAAQPLRVLLQRLGEERVPVSAHLDLASTDRTAEVGRHEALGAVVQRRHENFTVLSDPTGLVYCVTDRDPETGVLG